MKKLVATFLFLLITLGAWAQVTTSNLTGMITDLKGERLPGTTVLLTHLPTGTKYGTTTDTDGRYRIFNMIPGGPYQLTTTYVGYKNQTTQT